MARPPPKPAVPQKINRYIIDYLTSFQGLPAIIPEGLIVGFMLALCTLKIRFYAWREPEPVSAIDSLEAHYVVRLRRR